MNIIKNLEKEFGKVFEKLGYEKEDINITFSNRPELCDFQCNSAFSLSKKEKKSPLLIANLIAEKLDKENFDISVANPGFINLKIKDNYFSTILKNLFN